MDQTGNSFGSNPASLKGKLQTLEVLHPLSSNKSKTFPTSSTTTRSRYRSCAAKRTPWSQSLPWRLQTSRRVFRTSWSALRRRCKHWVDLGRGISTSKKRRIAEYSSRSPHWREKRQPCSSSCSACRGGSPNWRCKSAVKDIDRFHLLSIKISQYVLLCREDKEGMGKGINWPELI